jgi:hypothetical protein
MSVDTIPKAAPIEFSNPEARQMWHQGNSIETEHDNSPRLASAYTLMIAGVIVEAVQDFKVEASKGLWYAILLGGTLLGASAYRKASQGTKLKNSALKLESQTST